MTNVLKHDRAKGNVTGKLENTSRELRPTPTDTPGLETSVRTHEPMLTAAEHTVSESRKNFI